MTWNDLRQGAGPRAIGAYLSVWGAATMYLAWKGADWTFPIVALLIFGVTLSSIAWGLTRKIDGPTIAVGEPRRESVGLLAYVAVYAVVFVGWGIGFVQSAIEPGQAQEIASLAYKLVIHLVLPALVIVLLGGAIRPLFAVGISGARWWFALVTMSVVLFALLALVSPSLSEISALNLALPAVVLSVLGAWFWMSLEAGLAEEFLFRAALQSRLTAWLKSPVVAILLVSIIFALAHWPGLYFRGTAETQGYSADPIQVAAYTVAALSPLSILFGVIWQRTHSLLLVVLLHGAVNALPFTAEFVHTWR